MEILAVNICTTPETVTFNDKQTQTGIIKTPQNGPVQVHELGLEGDTISNKKVHGGPFKAVYAFGLKHYAPFQERFPDIEMPHGFFGENLTIGGAFDEADIHLGDQFKAGSVILEAAEPRCPCKYLGWRFGTQKVVKAFTEIGQNGVYFQVIQPGTITAGDAFEQIKKGTSGVSIQAVGKWLCSKHGDPSPLKKALAYNQLSPHLKESFEAILAGSSTSE